MSTNKIEQLKKTYKQIDTLLHAYRGSQVLFTAFESGLLELLTGPTPKNCHEIAAALKLSETGVKRLLTALCALGIAEGKNESYRLSSGYRTLFNPDSDKYLGGMVAHEIHLQKRWLKLAESLTTGLPVKKLDKPRTFKDSKRFIHAMAALGHRSSNQVIKKTKLEGSEHILDLGGGPGAYMRAFCEHYPDVKVTLFDQSDSIHYAKKSLASHPAFNRMFFKKGDLFKEAYGENHDVIFISNVVHIFSADEILSILKKCYSALKSSGRLLIKDFFLNEDETGPEFSALFSLHMMLSTAKGGCYKISEMSDLLKRSGFRMENIIKLKHNSRMLDGVKTPSKNTK